MKGSDRKWLFAAMCLAAATPLAEAAGDDSAAIAPVVVTASRIPGTLADTTASVTIISQSDIAARSPASVTELLRQVPGMHVDQPGGRGSTSSVYIRGSDPNYTLVLMDGIAVNDPTNNRGGSFDFSTLDIEHIERIEIVRGPLSAVYGSNALGGVINIITREGEPVRASSLTAGVGESGMRNVAAGARGPFGSGDYSVTAAFDDAGNPVEDSEYLGRSLGTTVRVPTSDAGSLKLVTYYGNNDSAAFPEDSGGPTYAVLRDVDQRDNRTLTVGIDFNHEASAAINHNIKLNYYEHRNTTNSPGVAPGLRDPFGIPMNTEATRFSQTSMVANTVYQYSKYIRLSGGIDVRHELGVSDSTLVIGGFPVAGHFSDERTSYAPFAEIRYRAESGTSMEAGLRIDKPEGVDPETSPRLGVSYPLTDRTVLRSSWARGFKLPSFYALGNSIVGNPDLKPERSENIDVGLEKEFDENTGSLNITYFRSRYKDMIDFDAGPPPRLVNRSETIAEGVELATNRKFGKQWQINGHVSYTKTDLVGSEQELLDRPEWRAGIEGRGWLNPESELSVSALYVGELRDSSIPTGEVTLGDYTRVDAALTWYGMPQWEFTFAVDNVLDADYEEAVGFPAPGILARLTAKVHF